MKGNGAGFRKGGRILRILLCILGGAAGLLIAALIFFTFWLTPDRLTRIATEHSSEYFNADIKFSNLRFTLWSSFPRLMLKADSISIRSRVFDKVGKEERSNIPDGGDFLGSCSEFEGGVNLEEIIRGRIRLHNVVVDNLRVNLVTLNDSLSNYDILPSTTAPISKFPPISANSIKITHPEKISFTSVPSGLNAEVSLQTLTVKETRKRNSYDLRLHGLVSASVDKLRLLAGFPFDLSGEITMRFNPIGVSFSNYGIRLGGVKGKATMEMNGGETPKIGKFSYSIEPFRLLQFLEMFPAVYIPGLNGINTSLTVEASASLMAPWKFSSSTLPSIRIDFDIADGRLNYTDGSNIRLGINDIKLNGAFIFNGNDPDASYAEINRLNLRGDWGDINIKGIVSNVTSSPHVTAEISGSSDMKGLGKVFLRIPAYKAQGTFTGKTRIEFDLSGENYSHAGNIRIEGYGELRNGKVTIPGSGCEIKSGTSNINYASRSKGLDFGAPFKSTFDCEATLKTGPAEISGKGFSVKAGELDLVISGKLKGEREPEKLSLLLGLRKADYRQGNVKTELSQLRLVLTGKPGGKESERAEGIREYIGADSLQLTKVRHTPPLLSLQLPQGVRDFMTAGDFRLSLQTGAGEVTTAAYPDRISLKSIDLESDLERLDLRLKGISCSNSTLDLKITTPQLLPFLTDSCAVRLPVKVEIKGDTIDFNRIARCVKDLTAGTKERKETIAKRNATPALLLPRNIFADIILDTRQFNYSNLRIRNLKSKIRAERGDLSIDTLSLGTSFATAGMKIGYETGNVERMNMRMALDIADVNLQKFFEKFPTLVEMCQSLRNVSGKAGLQGNVSFHIFPDMEVQMASMESQVKLTGDDIVLKQNNFIHRIIRMMGIHNNKPINMEKIGIRLVVHDNLLEVYPFTIAFERYRLEVTGVNNFAGDLDYHVGVLHSPVPFPFGINVEGKYHKPKLRFGGPAWKESGATDITSGVMKSFTVNMTRGLTRFGNAFIDKAASGTSM